MAAVTKCKLEEVCKHVTISTFDWRIVHICLQLCQVDLSLQNS